MATARETTDHDEIREWVERNGGRPAQVEGTGGMLRIDFGDEDARLEPIEWDRFFDIFDRSGLGFLYDPDGHMNKFIQVGHDETGIGRTEPEEARVRKAASRGPRKRSTSRRKKSATTSRKKSSSSSRKKSTTTRKKSTASRKKSTASRKKSTAGRKKSTSARKKSTTSRKKSPARKKSSGGRKYGRKTGKKVERAMHEMKRGQLRSGSKGPKVKSRKQAIAIGLSEARREGDKVPPRRRSGGRKKKR